MEKKNKGLIITIVVLVVCVFALGGYLAYDKLFSKKNNSIDNNINYEKTNSNNQLKMDINTLEEQKFINNANYIGFTSTKKAKEIIWSKKEDIFDEKIDNKKVIAELSVPSGDVGSDTAALTEDGSLYYKKFTFDNFDKMNTGLNIKRIGNFYIPSFECEYGSLLVLETNNNERYVMVYDLNKNKYTFDKEFEKFISSLDSYLYLPGCYGFMDKLKPITVNYTDAIKFYENSNIKENDKDIAAEYIIFVDGGETEKYYVVSKDNKLYILDKVTNNSTYVADVKNVTTNNYDNVDYPVVYGTNSGNDINYKLTITFNNDEKLDFNTYLDDNKEIEFKGKVTGYITKSVETSGILEGNGETKELVFFNITSTDNSEITKFINEWQGNTYVNETGFSLGCLENGNIKRYNSYDNSNGNKEFIISGSDAQKILNSNANNKITLEIEKLKLTGGSGAPLCYSHLTNISIVD